MLDTSVLYNIKSALHRNLDAVLGSVTLKLEITVQHGKDQLIEQKCLVLRPALKLDIILLGNDFLHQNAVKMSYNKDNTKKYEINDIPVVLLTEPIDANLMTWFPDSFLAITELEQFTSSLDLNGIFSRPLLHAQKVLKENPLKTMNEVKTENQKRIQEFFHLKPTQIDDLKINAFLNNCKTAKTKYF